MGKFLLKLSVLFLLCTVLYPMVGCGKPNPQMDESVKAYPSKDESGKVDLQKRYKQNIITVVKRQNELEVQLGAPFSSDLSKNEILDEMARRLSYGVQSVKESLNYDELPSDFVSAYLSYLNACQKMSTALDNHPNFDPLTNVIDGFLTGFSLDFSSMSKKRASDSEWESRIRQCEEDMDSTLSDVEAVAAKYGVNVHNCE